MKPEPGNKMSNSREESTLERVYESISLLVVESRLPDAVSGKGRKDGVHLQHCGKDSSSNSNTVAVGSNATVVHRCSYDEPQCDKMRKYREIMTSLCRNGIPLCIEVLLCPECELGTCSCAKGHDHEVKGHDHEVRAGQSNSYVLLEQWTIQQVHRRSDQKSDSLQNLVQAVRSQLCFSQLSAWLQSSEGVSPKHIFYRLTAPGEWFVHKFVMSPQSHTFPDAALVKGLSCRVTMSSLPRTSMTPYEISLASRDKLFAVKDPSPPLKKSHSSYSSLRAASSSTSPLPDAMRSTRLSLCQPSGSTSAETDQLKPTPITPQPTGQNHEVSGHGDRCFGAQRCLTYSSDDMAAADRFSSFSLLPVQSVNELESIPCHVGRNPPNRLPISSQTTKMPLKSPKVLFTRTRNLNSQDFFSIPPIIDSLLDGSSDAESDLEADGASFIVGDDMNHTSHNCEDNEPQISAINKRLDQDQTPHQNGHNTQQCHENGTPQTNGQQNTPQRPILQNIDNIQNEMKTVVTQDGCSPKLPNADNRSRRSLHEANGHSKHPAAFPHFMRSRLFKKQLPSQSSPAPVKRLGSASFDFDATLTDPKSLQSAISCSHLNDAGESITNGVSKLLLSSSAPALTSTKGQTVNHPSNSLLGNFEESLLNGRIEPAGLVEGFTVDIGASGSFCPPHVKLPVTAYFFNSLSDDDAPSPYLGFVDLGAKPVRRRGYQVPQKGTLQITLFYPNDKVNKMFVVSYDLSDMPAQSQTFLRQKTVYAPCNKDQNMSMTQHRRTYLRYLIHLRFRSTKVRKIYLHTDIRLIYARDKFEFDSNVAVYELRSFIEAPANPKYSPLK